MSGGHPFGNVHDADDDGEADRNVVTGDDRDDKGNDDGGGDV